MCLSIDTEVEASPVDGPGFKIDRASPKAAAELFIFATGSGITGIKALIESGGLQVVLCFIQLGTSDAIPQASAPLEVLRVQEMKWKKTCWPPLLGTASTWQIILPSKYEKLAQPVVQIKQPLAVA